MAITFAGRTATNGLTGLGLETGNPAGLTLVADPVGAPGQVLRAHMALGDAQAGGSYRSEASTYSIRAPIGQVAWYWFETYVSDDWIRGGKPACIWQMHDLADGGDNANRHSPFECFIAGTEFVMESTAATGDADDTPVERYGIWRCPLITNRWVSWVVKADWRYQTTGSLTIWKDRRRVYAESGVRTCYNDVQGLFPKFGVYVPEQLSADVPSRTVYHRGMVTGDNAYGSFDAFMAAAGTSQTELEPVMCRGALG